MTTAPKPRRRRRWILLGLLAIVAGLVVYAAVPGKNTYTVGPETTHVTDPIDANGRVDYVAAVNTRLRGDITPEQNANVFIWQAIGPHPENSTLPDEYFQWLGRPAPPDDGDYLISLREFRGDPALPPELDVRDYHGERRDRAAKWPWAAVAEPDLAEWVAANERPLAAFTRASTRPASYSPLVPARPPAGDGRLMSSLLPASQAAREGGRLLACRAMLRLGAGRADEAWQDLMACHRLGRLVGRAGTLIELLVGVVIQGYAIQGEMTFLSRAPLSAARIAACRADLRALPPAGRVADILAFERFVMLDTFQNQARPEPAAPAGLFSRGVNWDAGARVINETYDRWIAAAQLEDYQARRAAMDGLLAEIMELARRQKEEPPNAFFLSPAGRGRLAGEIVVRLTFPAAQKLAAAEVSSAVQNRCVTVAFALAAYRADTGKYPPALADLAPKYLPDIPKDIYVTGDLKYRLTPAGYRLYSVGPNLADDEGRGRQDDPKGDDLAIEMPAKEPPPVKKPEPEPE